MVVAVIRRRRRWRVMIVVVVVIMVRLGRWLCGRLSRLDDGRVAARKCQQGCAREKKRGKRLRSNHRIVLLGWCYGGIDAEKQAGGAGTCAQTEAIAQWLLG